MNSVSLWPIFFFCILPLQSAVDQFFRHKIFFANKILFAMLDTPNHGNPGLLSGIIDILEELTEYTQFRIGPISGL